MVSGVMIHGVTFPVVRQQKSAWENCFFCDRKALKLKKLSQEKGEKSKRITLVQHRSEKNATGGKFYGGNVLVKHNSQIKQKEIAMLDQ